MNRLTNVPSPVLMAALVSLDGNCDNDDMFADIIEVLNERYGSDSTERTAELFTHGHYSHEDMLVAIGTEWSTVEAALRGDDEDDCPNCGAPISDHNEAFIVGTRRYCRRCETP